MWELKMQEPARHLEGSSSQKSGKIGYALCILGSLKVSSWEKIQLKIELLTLSG